MVVEGFTGAVCDTNIDDCTNTSCLNGGQCVDGINSSSCNCTTGESLRLAETV